MRMTEDIAAAYLGVAPETLRQWRHLRKGPPYYKIGGIHYDEKELHEWRASKRVAPEEKQ